MNMQKCLFLFTLLLAPSSTLGLFAQVAPLSLQTGRANDLANDPNVHPLQISAGDLLDVKVFDTAELSGKLRVDDHGNIALPLAGEVTVSKLTADEAGRAIEAKLLHSNILKNPHVSVMVLEYSTQGITVLGEVKQPGVYPLLGPHVLLDLISAAGGFTPDAGELVTITHRADPNHPVVLEMGTGPGDTAGSNIDIRPGDIILVSHAGIVYVLGDVGKPGGFLIQRNTDLTVLQAVSLAQGANKTAALNSAKLIHQRDGKKEEFNLPLRRILSNKEPDRTLADGDIIFVPTSAAKNALATVASILPATAGAAIYRAP
jgi:polysaccharide export outer membrane protein